jgi:hypothetical protein
MLTHPATQVGIGLCMVASGLSELGSSLHEVIEQGATSAHGVLLFGAAHAMRSLIELFEGLEKVEETEEHRDEPRGEPHGASHAALTSAPPHRAPPPAT